MSALESEARSIAAAEEPTFEQSRAIDAGLDGPFLVDAGAGTGKTFTLVQRAVKLVTTGRLRPHELLIVTFTNKAANEIAERIARTFASFGLADIPTCTTFHAFAGEIVREFGTAASVEAPFDARQIDDARARVLFRRVWSDFLEGRLGIDAAALPVGVRSQVLERDIASLALRLRARDVSLVDFESRARFAARQLAAQTWGHTFVRGKRKPRADFQPRDERPAESRRAEAQREERNVHAIVALLRAFSKVLDREGVVTFGDVISRATTLVGIDDVRRRLRERIAHALVDEFQDTNPQQLAFLRALFGEGLERVMAVGDIRQAIYGFNGADPEGIVRFGELAGCVRFPLTENRRSFQQILDAAHSALAAQADPLVPLDRPLVAKKGPSRELAVRAQAFGDGHSDVASGRALEAHAVAREIDALLRDGIPPRAIAILMRSRTNARPYIDALRDRNIAAKLHGGVGFFDAAEICDARAWMRFLADPTDRASLVRILQSRTLGFADGTVARLASDVRNARHATVERNDDAAFARAVLLEAPPEWFDARETERLALFRAIAEDLASVAAERASTVVRAIARTCGIDIAAARVQPLLAEQVRANLDKLVEMAASLERDRPSARLDDIVDELDEREALEIDEAEADVGLDRIAIVTAHGAKGLEWDYVFVVNVAKSTFPASERPRAETLDWHEPTGALALIYSVVGERPLRWYMRGDIDLETGERSGAARGLGEEARLFYVAMTRAKTRLYVTGPLERDRTSPFLDAVLDWGRRNGIDDATMALSQTRAAEQPSFDFAEVAAAQRDARGTRRAARWASAAAQTLALVSDGGRVRLSYSSIAAHARCPRFARYRYRLRLPDFRDDIDASAARLREIEPAGDGADSSSDDGALRPIDPARFGLAVHRALEVVLRARIAAAPASADAVPATVEAAAAEFELEANEVPLLARSVAGALATLGKLEPLAVEERFEVAWGNVDLTGAIDLIVRLPDGRRAVVDYKTGRTPVAEHRLQLSLYRRAYADSEMATPAKVDETRPETDPRRALAIGILSVNGEGSELTWLDPFDEAVVDDAVAAAARGGDEPRPGETCSHCPYAGALCPEGRAARELRF